MRYPSRLSYLVPGAVLLASLAACGTQPGYNTGPMSSYPVNSSPSNNYPASNYPGGTAPNYVEFGRVTGVEIVRTQEPGRGTGAGAVIGAIGGAVIGNQIGSGSGRDVARIAGVVGGAVAGNAIEKNVRSETRETFRVSVRIDNGTSRAYDVPSSGDLRVGDRVRIENNQIYRL